ncbi:class I adenylate-forming enzyme family protein [Herbaspirillum sp. YR522]|uniref:class I adenylate-forming enzyme family protein n=1 Tax=Herbaspirillum sp. YR522 TaxID=1144342 RepID=UPI00026F99D3|nr:class I adenylate-forming enzyme family protein [Herbaspirillum sp. YR522]EJN06629.1 acyl-CoA synthetase (AMP-forming)/AMP-acid ligase II [Herbaspirillum sp. YR522]
MSQANLGRVIERTADPQRVALFGIDGDGQARQVSYGELDAQADALARGLLAAGHRAGERIALLALNSVDYIAALLGIMRAGLVAVPVNLKLPAAQLNFIVADSGATRILCDQARLAQAPQAIPAHAFGTPGYAALLDPGPLAAFEPGPQDQALLLYTSGSTGRPKGVRLSHASHRWVIDTRIKATPVGQERLLIAAPLYHMNALALALLALASHATTVLLPQFSARAYLDAIDRYRCTWLTAVPPMIAMMLREQQLLGATDLSSVRVVRMGSAPVSPGLLAQIRQLLPTARVINAYGTTEGGPVVFGPHPDGIATPMHSVGVPHPQVELRLVDGEGGEVAANVDGELQLRSAGMMLGYHRRPELRPFTDDGYYATGDVFRRDEQGFHSFVGRRDDMFVCGGENLYPGDIEKALERHPAVQQASVVPVPDDIKGAKPVAFVVRRAGPRPASEDELRQFSLQHLAAYQHPRRVWFVDALPLTTTQKIDRRALVEQAQRLLGA